MFTKLGLKAGLLSLLIFLIFIGTWSLATYHKEGPAVSAADAEYAAMMGKGAGKTGGFPPPGEVGTAFVSTCPIRSMTRDRTTRGSASSSPTRSGESASASCWR